MQLSNHDILLRLREIRDELNGLIDYITLGPREVPARREPTIAEILRQSAPRRHIPLHETTRVG